MRFKEKKNYVEFLPNYVVLLYFWHGLCSAWCCLYFKAVSN